MRNPEAELFERTANILALIHTMIPAEPKLGDVLEYLGIAPDELVALAKRHNGLARFMYQTGDGPEQPEARMRPLDDDDEHMTMGDFVEACECGGFIDYDGFGYYATATEKTDLVVCPSDWRKCKIDDRWTHVVWYNK